MKNTFTGLVLMVFYWLGSAAPVFAHHSFAAEFDKDKCADFTGVLTNVDWQNPHAYFTVDVKDTNGQVQSVTFETSALSTLKRAGTSRADFVNNYGKTVTVRGCPAKNGTKNRAAANTIKLPDGTVHRIGMDVEGIFGSDYHPAGTQQPRN
jgi:type 1 fimbria pilin